MKNLKWNFATHMKAGNRSSKLETAIYKKRKVIKETHKLLNKNLDVKKIETWYYFPESKKEYKTLEELIEKEG